MENALIHWLEQQQSGMEALLKTWCNINTGTENINGLAQMQPLIIDEFRTIASHIDIIEPQPVQELAINGEVRQVPVAPHLRISRRRPNRPHVFLFGHMDTVFPVESSFQSHSQLSERRLQGPGVTDMKGGILVMSKALQAFEQSPLAEQLSWEVFLNSDEETGSRSSMPELLKSAKDADYGLGYEPCMPHGKLAGRRKGSANFGIKVSGQAAHAGREFHNGRNAIAALCELFNQLHQLNQKRPSITLNLARVQGGGPLNVVPDNVVGYFNIRVETLEDQHWFEQYIETALTQANRKEGYQFQLFGGFTRPPKLIDTKTESLFKIVEDCGHQLGLNIAYEATGGCCDGNNLAAAGLPTVDTLGVRGAHIHSDHEFIWLDSLCERAKLSYLILSKLALLESR